MKLNGKNDYKTSIGGLFTLSFIVTFSLTSLYYLNIYFNSRSPSV